jgi:hypothetical protein
MYSALSYPLDIIKTNRILQTSLSKENAESIPREFTALYEKGGLSRGLFRGFVITYIGSNISGWLSSPSNGVAAALGLTVLTNPF